MTLENTAWRGLWIKKMWKGSSEEAEVLTQLLQNNKRFKKN